jgi:BTB/POZ domain
MTDQTDVGTSNIAVSRDEMLERFLTDETLNNVALQGTDGVTVMANSYLLAARSQVFRPMFFGQFHEANSPAVQLGFHSSVLKAVVEYILTDSAGILNCKKRDTSDKPALDFQQIQLIVSLAEAACYFNLPGLGELVSKAIHRLLDDCPAFSFPFVQACKTIGPQVPEQLFSMAIDHLRTLPFEKITANEVSCLSEEVLADILKDSEMEMTEYELFQLLDLWVTGGGPQALVRHTKAKRLCKHISLGKIHPGHLSTTVTSSGLVESEQLFEAYKYQAVAYSDKKLSQEVFISPRTGMWTAKIIPSVKRFPSAIKVTGAGSKAVNGVYVRDGVVNGYARYTMEGTCDGDAVSFWLYARWTGCWYIEIASEDYICMDSVGRDVDEAHYAHDYSYDSNLTAGGRIPPCGDWKATRGNDPAPKLLYSFRSQSTSGDDATA